ncbi:MULTISPECIES: hypothetical protein [Streptomyces]|uniref:Integral membrane protein n=1 Tax=Streptomyces morookaense TaxID=1970 RepID=A0A7Y7E687_STRMO|nr:MULTISPECIES: hypothetical protein [Streptomyces]MCC2275878.1 hypothetical protein [Streptomyces sp. ET3-23]NVK77610.1 hypothetical protein [Streptomyces morookaense]GHF05838.1 membrane protein [Streptomyces morookaense]
MNAFLLSAHVLAAVIAVGPVTVAASMFPAAVRHAVATPEDGRNLATVRMLHRICRVYAVVGVAVPVFGFATAKNMHVLGDTWLIVSMALTAVAAVVLGALVLPGQGAVVARLEGGGAGPLSAPPARLALYAGLFNLLWAAVTVLMIVRPGSTTGV